MGFVIECEKCKRTYDTKYFIEFCPWCYVDYDKLKNQLEEALKREYEAVCGEYSAYKDLEQEYKALLKSDSLTNQMTQQSLIAALAHISKLTDILNRCKTAMTYAYEDHCDQYYLNVIVDIEEVLNPERFKD